jgi:hypothetical protein
MNNIIRKLLFAAICVLPCNALAEINTFYDAKLKMQETKDAFVNSPIYGMTAYFGGAIIIFIIAIIIFFALIMMLRR